MNIRWLLFLCHCIFTRFCNENSLELRISSDLKQKCTSLRVVVVLPYSFAWYQAERLGDIPAILHVFIDYFFISLDNFGRKRTWNIPLKFPSEWKWSCLGFWTKLERKINLSNASQLHLFSGLSEGNFFIICTTVYFCVTCVSKQQKTYKLVIVIGPSGVQFRE